MFFTLLPTIPLFSIERIDYSTSGAIAQQENQQNTQKTSNRAAAEIAFAEGEKLQKQATAESRRQAINKYSEAVTLFQAAGNRAGEAVTRNCIGNIYKAVGENQKALESYKKSLPLRHEVGDNLGEAITLANIGSAYNLLGEKKTALDYYNQALQLFRAVENSAGEAIALNNIGNINNALGEKQKAVDYYNQALSLRRAKSDSAGSAVTLTSIGNVYNSLGDKQKALDYYNQSLPLFTTAGNNLGEAVTLNNIGNVYNSLGDKQKALDYYNQSLPLRRAVGNQSGEAVTRNAIGNIYNSLGDKQTSLNYYNQSLKLFHAAGNRPGEATILNNIGNIYNSWGNKPKALDYYNQSLTLRRATGNKAGEAVTLVSIGRVYNLLGENRASLHYYNQSLLLFRAAGKRAGEAVALNNIGNVYESLGEKQTSLHYYNQSLALRLTLGDKVAEAVTLNNIGNIYNSLGEKQDALDYYKQSLLLSRVAGNRSGEAVTLKRISNIYNVLGEKQTSQDYYNQSLALTRAARNRKSAAATLKKIGNIDGNVGKKQKVSEDNLSQALTQMQASLKIIESSPVGIESQQLQNAHFTSVQDYYKFYIDLLMQLHKTNPSKGYDAWALYTSERAKARSLLDILDKARVDIRQGANSELLQQEHTLKQLLSAKEKRRAQLKGGEDDLTQSAAIQKEIDALLNHYREVQGRLQVSSPNYAALTQPLPLTPQQIQSSLLDDDTLLLEYSLGEKQSYLWAVTKNDIYSYSLPKQVDIEEAVHRFRQKVTNPYTDKEEYRKTVAALSQILLKPVARQLDKKRLLIVSDGAVEYVPFSALVAPGEVDESDTLVLKHDIINLPSAYTLHVLRHKLQRRQRATKTVAIVAADIEFNRLRDTHTSAEQILASVPHSERQAFNFVNFAASPTTVINSELSKYGIVHFATPGILDGKHPELSGVALSRVDENGATQNRFLRLNDIYNLNLSAKLVVLSACQAGLDKDIKGEGLTSLTRGFMYAGARQVLVSLWYVDDKARAELMKRFYTKMLKEKLSPTKALRAAQLEMSQIPEWNLPYYWAGFVLQGDWK